MIFKKCKRIARYKYDYYKYNKYSVRNSSSIEVTKKSIVMFTHELSKTGAPVLLLQMVKWLSLNGWKVIVISHYSGVLIQEYSKYCTVMIRDTPKQSKDLLKDLYNKGIGVALTNSVVTGLWINELKKIGFNTISLIHELPQVIKDWDATEAANSIADRSDVVVFPSSYVEDKYNNLVSSSYSSRILTQGVFLKESKKDYDYDYIVDKFGLERKPLVLNVASGNYRKGADLFVELSRMLPDVEFIWVGGIDKKILKQKKYNDKRDKNLKIIDYIDDKALLKALYANSSVFVLTSREEPFGSVVLESMSCGTPVIGFKDSGGFKDVVEDHETGYLVERECVACLKDKIVLILTNDNLRNNLSYKCRERSKKYNFDEYMNSIEILINAF